jgi:hypothetical protein
MRLGPVTSRHHRGPALPGQARGFASSGGVSVRRWTVGVRRCDRQRPGQRAACSKAEPADLQSAQRSVPHLHRHTLCHLAVPQVPHVKHAKVRIPSSFCSDRLSRPTCERPLRGRYLQDAPTKRACPNTVSDHRRSVSRCPPGRSGVASGRGEQGQHGLGDTDSDTPDGPPAVLFQVELAP